MNIEKLHLQNNFNYKNTLCKIKKQQIVKPSAQLSLQNFQKTSGSLWNQPGQETLPVYLIVNVAIGVLTQA